MRTHKLSHVVNQYSRFHMSAGIEETATGGNTGRHSPLMMSSLQQIKQQHLPGESERERGGVVLCVFGGKERRNCYSVIISKGSMSGEEGSDHICVRAHFALTSFENSTNSLKIIGNIHTYTCSFNGKSFLNAILLLNCYLNCCYLDFTERKAEYSLYILGGDGSLTEYTLQPDEGTSPGTGGGGVNENCEEALIELQSAPKITWRLLR